MKVAITGTLSMPRDEAIKLIETRTGATASVRVTYDTDYLVTANPETFSARRAAWRGITVISERQMMAYIKQGAFPERRSAKSPVPERR